jgi:hypothetical protein
VRASTSDLRRLASCLSQKKTNICQRVIKVISKDFAMYFSCSFLKKGGRAGGLGSPGMPVSGSLQGFATPTFETNFLTFSPHQHQPRTTFEWIQDILLFAPKARSNTARHGNSHRTLPPPQMASIFRGCRMVPSITSKTPLSRDRRLNGAPFCGACLLVFIDAMTDLHNVVVVFTMHVLLRLDDGLLSTSRCCPEASSHLACIALFHLQGTHLSKPS